VTKTFQKNVGNWMHVWAWYWFKAGHNHEDIIRPIFRILLDCLSVDVKRLWMSFICLAVEVFGIAMNEKIELWRFKAETSQMIVLT
jgi:hypothetical protein